MNHSASLPHRFFPSFSPPASMTAAYAMLANAIGGLTPMIATFGGSLLRSTST